MARSFQGSESEEESTSTEENDSESFPDSQSDSDSDFVASGKRKRKAISAVKVKRERGAKAPPRPNYIAQITESANDGLNASERTPSGESTDKKMLDKIRKAIGLANHPGTGEAEAKAAMRMAMKLMAAENITQADLIANESAEERSTRAGHSTVTLRSTKGKSVRRQRWHSSAVDASCEAFDVQCYTERYRSHLGYVFYGLADNTVAAALSFEMLHNQIETWSLERKAELKGQVAGNSYRLGVARRVLRDSQEENRKALKKAEEDEKRKIKEEEEARAAEIARLQMPVVVAEPEAEVKEERDEKREGRDPKIEDVPDEDASRPSLDQTAEFDHHLGYPLPGNDPCDDDDSDTDAEADFDHRDEGATDFDLDALEKKIRSKAEQAELPEATENADIPPPSSAGLTVKVEPEEESKIKRDSTDGAPSWTSALQLRTFKDNAKAIGNDYLKGKGKKLRKGSKWKGGKRDKEAYRKGWDDGRKVDLRRRRIEDEAWKECKVESE